MFGKTNKSRKNNGSRRQLTRQSFECLEDKKLLAADLFQLNELVTVDTSLVDRSSAAEVQQVKDEVSLETSIDVVAENRLENEVKVDATTTGPIAPANLGQPSITLSRGGVDAVMGATTDMDGDGTVGFKDFLQFSKQYGSQVTPNTNGDFDGNGIVGFEDLLRFTSDFGNTPDHEQTVSCWLPTGDYMIPGENIVNTESFGDCGEIGGAVLGNEADPLAMPKQKDGAVAYEEIDSLPDDLQEDVDESDIPDREYEEDDYDCDDFAGDMEEELEKKGHDATFTLLWRWDAENERYVDGHAITDVHLDNGDTLWIEPQTGRQVKLDRDGDGKVNTFDRENGTGEREGDLRIEVYESRAEAERIFGPMD